MGSAYLRKKIGKCPQISLNNLTDSAEDSYLAPFMPTEIVVSPQAQPAPWERRAQAQRGRLARRGARASPPSADRHLALKEISACYLFCSTVNGPRWRRRAFQRCWQRDGRAVQSQPLVPPRCRGRSAVPWAALPPRTGNPMQKGSQKPCQLGVTSLALLAGPAGSSSVRWPVHHPGHPSGWDRGSCSSFNLRAGFFPFLHKTSKQTIPTNPAGAQQGFRTGFN